MPFTGPETASIDIPLLRPHFIKFSNCFVWSQSYFTMLTLDIGTFTKSERGDAIVWPPCCVRLKPEMQNSGYAYKILSSQQTKNLRLGWKLSSTSFLNNQRNRQREEHILSDFSGGCVTPVKRVTVQANNY